LVFNLFINKIDGMEKIGEMLGIDIYSDVSLFII